MLYIADYTRHETKTGLAVCGDYSLCARLPHGTAYVLADGIGSGVYACVSAVVCAERVMEHIRLGTSPRAASELAAASMHRARTEDMPFAAFSAAMVLPDGAFTVYTYESPQPLLLKGGVATALTPRVYAAGYEAVGECAGKLETGDSLLLMSDGVTQAGLGHGRGFGIGSPGVAEYINRHPAGDISRLPESVAEYCACVSGGRHEDDTSLALLHCREASELTLLTGPPLNRALNGAYAQALARAAGKKAVCGSTTIDIISRELGVTAEPIISKSAGAMPPEYALEGVDIATEGAITLNRVCNILGEPPEELQGNAYVLRLCRLLLEADVVHLHIGQAVNDAHEGITFKLSGVRVRRAAVRSIAEKLRGMGK
ncbi:MAG: SpoIIE family protein phosphatase, partial [Oscillospiraceae bacterium]|nr:SpoIIE family protein phosphatase [Oscillospiraceae bacterium]